jgi:hypothetical protein
MSADAELREKIRNAVFIWSLNGSEWPDELADEIMDLLEERATSDEPAALGEGETTPK